MKIKRFQAQSMREAIRLVREEQGPDAVILSNRRTADGIEVVAAVDYDAALMQQSMRRDPEVNSLTAESNDYKAAQLENRVKSSEAEAVEKNPSTANATIATGESSLMKLARMHAAGRSEVNARSSAAQDTQDQVQSLSDTLNYSGKSDSASFAPFADLLSTRSVASRQTESRTEFSSAARKQASVPVAENVKQANSQEEVAERPQADAIGITEFRQMQAEMKGMRKLLEEQLAGMMWGDMQQRRPRQAAAMRTLAEIGIEPAIAREIAEEIPEQGDAERARFLPLGLLSRRVSADCADPVMAGGVLALVGPTGVGKTTTIAKLAARYAARFGARDVALVTMDHYRVGAQEQLFTYGRLLGMPVHAIGVNEDLAEILDRLQDRKLVLIDTAGMSQRDRALNSHVERLRSIGDGLHTYLVLSANAQPASLEEVVRRFAPLKPAGCVLSKIDEASRVGGALSVAIRHQLPIAYFTDGQRVPEDLHAASADRLVLRATQLVRQSPFNVDDGLIASGFSDLVSAHA